MLTHIENGRATHVAPVLVGALLVLAGSLLALPAAAQSGTSEQAAVENQGQGDEAKSEAPAAAAVEAIAVVEGGPQIRNNPFADRERSRHGSFRITGDVLFNLQSVSVDGSESRFRKDFGYHDGAYLGASRLTFVPAGDQPKEWFDRLVIYGNGLGFESDKPNRYRSWGLRANKAGSYRFSVDSRTHNYFWLWPGDSHEWDVTRSFTDVDLAVNATENLEFTARYRHWSSTGDSIISYDYSREEYEFPNPVDQRGTTYGAGLRWKLGQTTLFLKQDFRLFKDNDYISDRDNIGLSPGGASIDLIEQREVRSMNAPMTSAGFVTNFADRKVRLEADFLYSDQGLGSVYTRFWDGISFRGEPTIENVTSQGDATRVIRHGNARLFWRPTAKIGLSAQYRRRGWDQSSFRFLGTEDGIDLAGYAYDVALDQFVLGAEFAPSRAFTLFGEFGTGSRKQDLTHLYQGVEDETPGEHADHEVDKTDFTSYRFGGRLRPSRALDLEASYERNDADNPFTRVAPEGVDAIKAKVRYRVSGRWVASADYTYSKGSNETLLRVDEVTPAESSFKFTKLGLNVSYTGGAGRFLYVGYGLVNTDRQAPIIFWNPSPRVRTDGDAHYDGTDNVFTVGGEYLLAATPLSLYGNLSYGDSDVKQIGTPEQTWGGTELFPLKYHDIRVGARYVFDMGLILDAQGRFMKYEDTSETAFALQTYDADMFVIGVGYRF